MLFLIGLTVAVGGLVIFDRVLRIRAMRRSRLPREVSVEQVQDVTLIPPDVQAYFHWADEALQQFSSLGTYTRTHGASVTQYMRAFNDPITSDLAIASVTQARIGPRLRHMYLLQFEASLVDGVDISTISTVINFPSPVGPQTRRTVIPEIADASILRQVHIAMVARHASTSERKAPWQAGFLPWWQGEMAEDQRRRIQAGHLRVDQKSGALQVTWKYILLYMLMTFWPVVRLRHMCFQRRANRILRSLGLPANYVRRETQKMVVRSAPSPPQTLFCPGSHNNLTGLIENRCPECGQTFEADQLAEWHERLPKPITALDAISEVVQLIVLLVFLWGLGAGFAYVVSKTGEARDLLSLGGLLATVFISGGLIKEKYASSCWLARRLAVTRARTRESEGSGLQDKTYIRIAWHAIFAVQLLAILAAAGAVLFLLF